jgi:hypothetical protein
MTTRRSLPLHQNTSVRGSGVQLLRLLWTNLKDALAALGRARLALELDGQSVLLSKEGAMYGHRLNGLIVVLWRAGLRIKRGAVADRNRPRRAPRVNSGQARKERPPPRGRHGPVGVVGVAALVGQARATPRGATPRRPQIAGHPLSSAGAADAATGARLQTSGYRGSANCRDGSSGPRGVRGSPRPHSLRRRAPGSSRILPRAEIRQAACEARRDPSRDLGGPAPAPRGRDRANTCRAPPPGEMDGSA